jgi:hypothetical protein
MPISHYVTMAASSKLYVPCTSRLSDKLEGTWLSKTENYLLQQKISLLKHYIEIAVDIGSMPEPHFGPYLKSLGLFYEKLERNHSGPTKEFLEGRMSYVEYQQIQKKKRMDAESEMSVLEGKVSKNHSSIKVIQETTYVSSWSYSSEQNLALWKIFGNGDDTIAITTTKEKLRSVVERNKSLFREMKYKVHVNDVEYVDNINKPSSDTFARLSGIIQSVGHDYLAALLAKPRPYWYENEVRLVAFPISERAFKRQDGIELDVQMKKITYREAMDGATSFIEGIYLPPHLTTDSPQYKAVIEINNQYGISRDLVKIDKIEI